MKLLSPYTIENVSFKTAKSSKIAKIDVEEIEFNTQKLVWNNSFEIDINGRKIGGLAK